MNSITLDDDVNPVICLETDRIENVIVKFTIAHIQYEHGEKKNIPPTHVSFAFANQLTDAQIKKFNGSISEELFPKVGSRWMQGVMESGDDWVIVQPGKYRYYIHSGQHDIISIVIGELLFCEVTWSGN